MRAAVPDVASHAPSARCLSARLMRLAALAAVTTTVACATAPPPVVAPPPPTDAQKMAAILQLEDRRTLVDAVITPASISSMTALLADGEGRVRRRAALAAGRVGHTDAVGPLSGLVAGDREPEVRAMAAFALGLIGDASAAAALLPALGDPDARVQGRAAEALGLIGHKAASGSIAGMAAAHVKAGVIAGLASDDETTPAASAAIDAVRLGVYALVRLEAFDDLRAVVIGADGQPVSDWWPFAFAMQRLARPAALPTLRTWLTKGGAVTRAFAIRGLATLKDADSRDTFERLAADAAQPLGVRVQAVRAVAALGDRRSVPALTPLVVSGAPNVLRLEATAALGAVADPAGAELLVDYLEDRWPSMRAAAQAALAKADPDTFMTVLSGIDVDREWRVRAALATTLGTLGPDTAALRLGQLARDDDAKVRAAALTSLAAVKAPGAAERLAAALADADPVVRMAAARGLEVLKAAASVPALLKAFAVSADDSTYVARAAILGALVALDRAAASPLVTAALADKDWAMRIKAATLARVLDPSSVAAPSRPAPPPFDPAVDDVSRFVNPAYSPEAYVQTSRGEFRITLAVLDAPRTVANFMALAGRGFFDGILWHRIVPDFVAQGGDPRGDGEGGPGYTIRDELNPRPYVRGTVGMALDWKDTGGSQFFVTHSPQPHLDARYTVFGTVSSGMDVVDRLEPFDQILSVRVWDGERWIGAAK